MHVKSDNKIKIEIPIFIVNMHSNQDKNESVKGGNQNAATCLVL
jgi:hypothetical protein